MYPLINAYGREKDRWWEVRDPRGELVCVTVYKRGAAGVVRRPVTNEMDPYECPGWNLWMSISRGLRSAPKSEESSDPVDWEHAFHLPYVDLGFVDKRIMGHVRDQSRRAGFRLTPAAVSHIRHAPDLKAVIRETQDHTEA